MVNQADNPTSEERDAATQATVDSIIERLRPLGNYIVVQQMKSEETMRGGIVIPAGKNAPYQGVVLAVGPGVPASATATALVGSSPEPMQTEVGDHVVFGQYAGNPLEIDSVVMVALKETDVIAILAPKETSDAE